MAVDASMLMATLRGMAWARAKGELQSILVTYWDEGESFDMADGLVKKFLAEMGDLLE